jgi:hypothetical protein
MKEFAGLLIWCCCTLVSSPVASQELSRSQLPPGVTISNAKWETFTTLTSSQGSLAGAPDSNPNRLPLPTQSTSTTLVRTQIYVYSIELTNNGAKPIKAIAWNFVFGDPANKTELLVLTLASLQKIDVKQKKTLQFTTHLAPPKVISAAALGKDKLSPFTQTVIIQCVLLIDNSTWEHANENGKACDALRRWIEQRKKWHPGLEDLPLTP